MLDSLPLVSIVTPVFNGDRHLRECIESVQRQTYPNWNYTISNNCSTDKSLEIAEKYAASDSRIKVNSNKSFVGPIENHNIAFRTIAGDSMYCKLLSADDWLYPDCDDRPPMFWEHEGNAAVCIGKGKLVRNYPGPWELYDMEADRTELIDLADRHPTKVAAMSARDEEWAARCGVIPRETVVAIMRSQGVTRAFWEKPYE